MAEIVAVVSFGSYMLDFNLTWRDRRQPSWLVIRPRRVVHRKHRRPATTRSRPRGN